MGGHAGLSESFFTFKKHTMDITKNLTLKSIEANKWIHDEIDREITTCWVLFFEFFGVDGFSAFITDEGIKRPYGSFAMIESEEGDLHESFSDTIELHWNTIVLSVNDWENENLKEQTAFVNRIEKNRAEAGLV
jgi:hypothetical protein